MAPPSSAIPRALAAVFAAWLMGLSLIYPSAARLDVWPWCGWWLAGAAVALLGGPMVAQRLRLGGGRDLALVSFAGVAVVSAWLSPWREGSLSAALGTMAGVAFLYLLVAGLRGPAAPTLRLALDLSAAALVTASLLRWVHGLLEAGTFAAPWSQPNEFPFGHVNYTAGAALLCLTWFGAQMVRPERSHRFPYALGSVLSGLVLLSSGSRAGIAALGIGLGLLLVAWWNRRGRSRHDAVVAASLLLIVLIGAVASNPRLRTLVTTGQWGELAAASNAQRAALAEAAIEIGRSHGFAGPGPGTAPHTYAANAGRLSQPFAPDGTLQFHSAPLQVWATMGPLGFFALALVLGTLTPVVVHAFDAHSTPDRSALGAGLAAYAVFALTDHQFDVPFIQLAVLAVIASLVAPHARAQERPGGWRGFVPLLAAVTLAAAPLYYGLRDAAARREFGRAMELAEAGDEPAARDRLRSADAAAPWDPFYREISSARRWESAGGRAAAAAELRAFLAEHRAWPSEFSEYNLAWLELDNDPAGAAGHFASAARLAPHRRGVHFGYALARLQTGDRDAAIAAFARELLANPRSVLEPSWETPFIRDLAPSIEAALRSQSEMLFRSSADPRFRARLAFVTSRVSWWLAQSLGTAPAERLQPSREAEDPLWRSMLRAPPRGAGGWMGMSDWEMLGRSWAEGKVVGLSEGSAVDQLKSRLESADSFVRFVTAPITAATSWRAGERTLRGGYRVTAGHPDAIVPADAVVFDRNLLLAPFVDRLFPARGWIPGAVWQSSGLLPASGP